MSKDSDFSVDSSDVQLKKAACGLDKRMYCDCCKTSIFYLHRTCPECHYDLCLQCCLELRDGNPQINKQLGDCIVQKKKAVPEEVINHDLKSLEDGRISCPPESMGGCGRGILRLVHLKPLKWVPNLLESTLKLLKHHKLEEDMREIPVEWCTCSDFIKKNKSDAIISYVKLLLVKNPMIITCIVHVLWTFYLEI
ncbi:hypothetical protein HanPI659440_Chr11g0409761 [Helianthus annuus]|nr:hypothetical protein HanPI659440_Chr11g0409761 [Helianthus annuus]